MKFIEGLRIALWLGFYLCFCVLFFIGAVVYLSLAFIKVSIISFSKVSMNSIKKLERNLNEVDKEI